jgi:hypothetical protein
MEDKMKRSMFLGGWPVLLLSVFERLEKYKNEMNGCFCDFHPIMDFRLQLK